MINDERQPIFIALGSNMGDREANLRQAIERIRELGFAVAARSSIYETEPVGYKEQPWFLNQVIEVSQEGQSRMDAAALLEQLLEIEQIMGRERNIPNGPRVIDIDLLFYGQQVIDASRITVPHPRLHLRRFVLEPLCEIAPEFMHARLKKSCRQLLAALNDTSAVFKRD